MKERIYEFNCPKCGNTSIIKFSDFLQHIKDDKKDISISFNRKCPKCKNDLRFSMKMNLFASVIENYSTIKLEEEVRSKRLLKHEDIAKG